MEKERDKDFIRCKKCNEPVSSAEIDFTFYRLPRFVDECKKCEYQSRQLLEKPKEDLIDSIKIAETFYSFLDGKLKHLEKRMLEQEKQVVHNHYVLNEKIAKIDNRSNQYQLEEKKKELNLEKLKETIYLKTALEAQPQKNILPTKKRKTNALSKHPFITNQFKKKTLNDYIVKTGLSQSALAKKTGISAPQISRLKTGLIPMTSNYATKLAKVFNIDKFDLMQ